MSAPAAVPEIHLPSFRAAELRSERARLTALLGAFAGMLALILIRGALSMAAGRHEAWPFALLLAAMTGYELLWLRSVKRAITLGLELSPAAWMANLAIESLLPTLALFLQIHTPSFGPERVLSSPVLLVYPILTILSTLRLDPALSRLAGVVSAAGYAVSAIFIFVSYPEVARADGLVVYGTAISVFALLLVGGFAAGTVAQQIRGYVVAALDDARNEAKIAQLEHDLGIARSIQQGLLPTDAPHVEGFEVAAWNQPADETGGDYYDWQQLPDGRLAVIVADATGHGIGPALIMCACRAYSRAGLAADADLQRLLDHLNQLLHADLPADKFVTLVAGLVDPRDGAGQLISAGHGPLVFYSAAEDSFHCFDAQGPPLGLLPRLRYGDAHPLKFSPGDTLVLVTDGFLEWANAADEEFGLVRLQEAIRAHRDQPPAKIIAAMREAITSFVGAVPQADDLTALVIKKV